MVSLWIDGQPSRAIYTTARAEIRFLSQGCLYSVSRMRDDERQGCKSVYGRRIPENRERVKREWRTPVHHHRSRSFWYNKKKKKKKRKNRKIQYNIKDNDLLSGIRNFIRSLRD